MYVTAFSSPRHPKWRWRITDINGVVIEESERTFDTIALAVAGGTERLAQVDKASSSACVSTVSATATGRCPLCGAATDPAEQFCGGDRCRAVFMRGRAAWHDGGRDPAYQ